MSENKKRRSANATEAQKKLLVEYVKKKPELISGKQSQNYTAKNAQRDWENISNILNSSPGASKEWREWRKTWHDLRSRTKLKESKNRLGFRGTGGGPLKEEPLSNIEEEVLGIIKNVSIQGHNVPESLANFQFDNVELNIDNQQVNQPHNQEVLVLIPEISSNILGETSKTPTEAHTVPPTISSTKKKLPKKVDNLINSAAATACFEKKLREKLDTKKDYYKQKILHMKSMENLKAKKVKALESVAKSLRILVRRHKT